MRLSVIGCGYLGAVHAASIAELGHDVVGVEVDQAKAERLAAGEVPFYEPGFEELLRRSLGSGRLSFTTDIEVPPVARSRCYLAGVGSASAAGVKG